MKKRTILSTFFAILILFTLASFNPTQAQQSVEDQFWDAVKNSKVNDDLESYIKEYPKGKYVALARLKIRQNSRRDKNKPPIKTGKKNFLITPNSVGDIRLGMTIAEARNVLKGVKFVQTDYSEEGVWVELSKNGTELDMRFMTDQKDNATGNTDNVPIKESAKIESIQFNDKRYKTADGVRIGMTIKDAEQIFGKIKKITFWEYDASEDAEFTNAPASYSFKVSAKEGSPREAKAGIDGANQGTTKRFNVDAYISSFEISNLKSGDPNSNNDAPKFEDYPAEEFHNGKNRRLVMDSFGKMFKTRLRNAIKYQKPTFAGKYIVTTWGCGSGGCNTGAIIDAKTGKAYPFPVSLSSVTQYNSEGEATNDFQEREFNLNSRLIKFAGNLEGSKHTNGSDVIEYYEFKNGKFIFVKSMPYGKSK